MIRLVIIEDEHWTRQLIKQFIQKSGLNIQIVGEAENGEEGFQLLQREKPDIIITDMQMPYKDGIDLLIKIDECDEKYKIIVLSGHDDYTYMRQAIRSGVVEYLLKPVDKKRLKHALSQCIEQISKEKEDHIPYGMIVFPNEITKIINHYKKQLHSLLTEHKNELIHDTLAKCIQELEEKLNNLNDNPEIWRRIFQDLVDVLSVYGTIEHEVSGQSLEGHEDIKFIDLHSITSSEDALSELIVIFDEKINKMASYVNKRSRINLNKIYDYVSEHYRKDISLEQIASLFYVSKEYLSKAYKEHFDENLTDHIRRLRMEEARNLIENTPYQIRNIASIVGFEDVSYFHRVFKNYYGFTPGSLRLENKQA